MRRLRMFVLPFLAGLALGLTSCADDLGEDDAAMPPRLEQPLVAADELQGMLGESNLVVIDARPTGAFAEGHIPGAISASFPEGQSTSNGEPVTYGGGLDVFLDVDNAVPFQDGDAEQVQAAARALGISNGSRVVVYDDGAHFYAARFAYTMEKHGFRNLHVLDGGVTAWTDAGGDLSTDVVAVTPGDFSAEPADMRIVATTDDVLAAMTDPDVVIVSSLWPDWHFGEYLAYSERGHIPTAVPVPMPYFFDIDATWRSPAQIRALLDVSGITPDHEVITYCGGNPLSACNYFTLRHVLGQERVRVYEGAMVAWLADERDLELHTWQHPEMLRDSDWIYWWAGERIQRLLLDAPAQVLDVRPAAEYDEGHIRWSVNVPAEELLGTSPESWAQTLGDAGIGTDREVVLCDTSITPEVTAMFWLLEYLGHDRVSVCVDGLAGWEARGYTLTDEVPDVASPTHPIDVGIHPAEFTLDVRHDVRLDSMDDETLHTAFPRHLIVASEEAPDETSDGVAIAHVPATELVVDGALRSAGETWALFEDAGASFFEELVVSGDSLGEASTAYFALRLLGVPMVRVYTGT